RVTILQPTRGVSQIARIGPAEVRARYGVEPEQVPDFIALRGDPSDRLPGARGVGEKGAADVLRRYGTLEAALADGRFSTQAEELELDERSVETLLDLARIAAHESGERTNAPLLCYLVGRAQSGADLDALADAVRSTS